MARSRIQWLRIVLMLLFLVSLGGIVYLLGFSGAEEPDGEEIVDDSSPSRGSSDDGKIDFQMRSEGFRQAAFQGDRALFDVEADEYRITSDQETAMVGVRVGIDRDEGRYKITSDTGTFDEERREALLEGNVVAVGPQPFTLWADGLELINQGQVIVASENSRFQIGDLATGTSRDLRVDLENQAMVMNRGVHVESLPTSRTPFSLDTRLLRFVDERRLIRTEGGAKLVQGPNTLEAMKISVYLNEFTDDIEFVRALWNVRGSLATNSTATSSTVVGRATNRNSPNTVDFSGMNFSLQLDELGRSKAVELKGTRRNPVLLSSRPSTENSRSVRAGLLLGTFREGKLDVVQGTNRVRVDEYGPHAQASAAQDVPANARRGPVLRWAVGESATTTFDQAGQIVRMDMEGSVELEELAEPKVKAKAERVSLRVLQEVTELFGDPMVEIHTVDGVLRAPRATYNQKLAMLEATGGTRTRLENSGALGASAVLASSGSGDGPVYVEAKDAQMQQEQGAFLFKGDVRAWQGKNLLITDQLRGSREGSDLTASGNVRTVWYTEPTEEEPAPQPIEVRSEFMEYLEADQVLEYEGEVTIVQTAGTMSCDNLRLALDENQQVETMHCKGGDQQASLVDPKVGRRIVGDELTYYPKSEQLAAQGKVEATEGARKIAVGALLYDLETGSYTAGVTTPEPGAKSVTATEGSEPPEEEDGNPDKDS